MALIFITGTSAAGKTTIAKELGSRGYEAYDTDHGNISSWYDKETGERVGGLNEIAERSEVWLDQHEWNISLEWVKEMARKAKHKNIFVCGGSHNKLQVRALCDLTIWLMINESVIRERLKSVRDHDYGKTPQELELILKWNKLNEMEHREYGAIMINATQPTEKVVDEIIRSTQSAI